MLGREMVLVNSIETMIAEYEARLGAMTNGFLESAGALLQQARDTETMYFQHLLDQAEGVAGIDHVSIEQSFKQRLKHGIMGSPEPN